MDFVSTKCSYNVKNYKPLTDIVQLEVVENWDIMHNVLQRRKPRQILSISNICSNLQVINVLKPYQPFHKY